MAPRSTNGNGKNNNISLVMASIAVLLTVFQGFWNIADPRGTLTKLEAKFDHYVPIREFEQDKKNDRYILNELKEEIKRVAEIQRSRSVTQERVAATEKQMDDVKKQLDNLSSSATIRDTLRDLQDQIKSLRDKTLVPKSDIK